MQRQFSEAEARALLARFEDTAERQRVALSQGDYAAVAQLGEWMYRHSADAYMAALDLASLRMNSERWN